MMASIANMNMNMNNFKGIVYCRLSKLPDASRGILSLDSQEFAIKNFMDLHGISVYSVTKHVGSAYNTPQEELKQLLKSCRNKILIVYEPNRLSRNIENFNKIWKICRERRHTIAIVSQSRVFNPNNDVDYSDLLGLIRQAQKESSDMGARISRTAQYKKSREPAWGKMRTETGEIIDNFHEKRIAKLIMLLSTAGSLVSDIQKLIAEVGNVEGQEPFEIVEYQKGKPDIEIKMLPYGMSLKNIENTFKLYGVRKRRSRWTTKDIQSILSSGQLFMEEDSIDDLCGDFEEISTDSNDENMSDFVNVVEMTEKPLEWIAIWYDPSIGLPPNIKLPQGMELPSFPTTLYIPK